MPLPQPKEEEEKNDFITRCVETPIMNEDFPKIMQRIAVCVSQWDNNEIENAGEVRENKDCADGYEHMMPNGEWMCGKTHPTKEGGSYGNEIYFDHEYNFTKEEMKELHDNGVLYATQIDGDGTEMTIKFTYNKGEESNY